MHLMRRGRAPELALGLVFVVVRLAATVAAPVYREPDTPGYFRLQWWGGTRLPTVPLLYSIVSDERALVVVQALIGTLAWIVAAVVLLRPLQHRPVRLAAGAGIATLGVSAPVVNWDDALMSESLSISLALLLVAAVVAAFRRPSAGRLAGAWGCALAWALVRQNNVVLVALAALVLAAVGTRPRARRAAWRLAVGFAAIGAVGFVLSSSNHDIARENVAQIVVRRILPDDAARHWFVGEGMPEVADELRSPTVLHDDDDVFAATAAIRRDRAFEDWLVHDGTSTYGRYLATHPVAAFAPLVTEHEIWRAIGTGTVTVPVGHTTRHWVPWLVEVALWPDRGVVLLVDAVVLALVGLAVVRGRRRVASRDARVGLVALAGVVVLAAVNVPFVVDTAGAEYGRLFMTTGVLVRVALVAAGAFGLDALGGPTGPGATAGVE